MDEESRKEERNMIWDINSQIISNKFMPVENFLDMIGVKLYDYQLKQLDGWYLRQPDTLAGGVVGRAKYRKVEPFTEAPRKES